MKRLAIVCRRKHLRGLSELAIALRFTRQRLAATSVVMINVRIYSCFFFARCFHCLMGDVKKFNQKSVAVIFEDDITFFSPSCTRVLNRF